MADLMSASAEMDFESSAKESFLFRFLMQQVSEKVQWSEFRVRHES